MAVFLFTSLWVGHGFADQSTHQVEVDGRQLHVTAAGQGKPIIFVHGWLANSETWQNQIDYFSNFFRVIAFDLTGFGASDKPSVDEIEYNHALWDRDIEAIIDAFELKDVVLVGWSSGSSSVVSYTSTHPEDVAKIVLVGTIPMSPIDGSPEEGSDLTDFIAADFDGFVEFIAPTILSDPGSEAAQELLKAAARQSNSNVALESYWNYLMPDRTPLLAQIDAPALLIHGAEDAMMPVVLSQITAAALPDATLHIIAGRGHGPHITSPALFNVLMHTFLASEQN